MDKTNLCYMTLDDETSDVLFYARPKESAFVKLFIGYIDETLHPRLMNCDLELRIRMLREALNVDLERGVDPIAEWRFF